MEPTDYSIEEHRYFVLDEADRMLDMDLLMIIKKIIGETAEEGSAIFRQQCR